MNIAIILAGGRGTRMGYDVPKQHILVEHHQIIEYTLLGFQENKNIDKIVIVSHKDYIDETCKLSKKFSKIHLVCAGGETRMLSVLNGVKAISSFAAENDKVIISDAARPCVTIKEVNNLLNCLDTYSAATSGIQCYETILKTNENRLVQINQRDGLVRQTSPEGYLFKMLKWLYLDSSVDLIKKYRNIGIDQLFASGQEIGIVESNPLNFKITTQEDLKLFENVLRDGFLKFIHQ